MRPFEGTEIAPRLGYGLEINVLELSGGVTIYDHGGVPGYLTGMFFMRGTERQSVTSFSLMQLTGEPLPSLTHLAHWRRLGTDGLTSRP